jgi:predicted dehydrogenase
MGAKIAVIGAGSFGDMHLRAFSQMEREGKAEVVGIADIDEALLEKRQKQYDVATFTDYREMVEKTNPNGVTIATPDFLHREIAVHCLEAGKHVLVEKPLDISVAGCREMIDAAEANRLLLQVDFHKRYDPYHRELEELVALGQLGEIEYGYAYMEDRIDVPRDRLAKWAEKSSPGWFLGVHMYDLIRWVIKSDGRFVSATGLKKKLRELGIDAYDHIQAKIVFANEASFAVDVSWILPDGHEAIVNQGIRVAGTKGMMEVDTQDRGARGCFMEPTDNRPVKGPGMQTFNLGFMKKGQDRKGRDYYSGYGIESIQDFAENVNHLLDGGSLEDLKGKYPDGHDGLEATKIAVAVHKSVEAGGAIVDLLHSAETG